MGRDWQERAHDRATAPDPLGATWSFLIGACLGAKIAFEELFRRIPDYAVSGPIVRVKTPADRALESLPVTF